MPIEKEPVYFNNKDQSAPVQIAGLSFQRPDYDLLKKAPFWMRRDCLDVLAHLQNATGASEKLALIRNKYISENTRIEEYKKELSEYRSPKWITPSSGISRIARNPLTINDDAYQSYKEEYNLHIDAEYKIGAKAFDEKHPEVVPVYKFISECIQFVNDLFLLQDFPTVNHPNGTPLKCTPKDFMQRARGAGFKISEQLTNTFSFEIENLEDKTSDEQVIIEKFKTLMINIGPEIEGFYNQCRQSFPKNTSLSTILPEQYLKIALSLFKNNKDHFSYLKEKHISDPEIYETTSHPKRSIVGKILIRALTSELPEAFRVKTIKTTGNDLAKLYYTLCKKDLPKNSP